MDSSDIDLIARIYDTALTPTSWPEVLYRVAQHLGAAGAFIFEVRNHDNVPQIASRLFSANYDRQVVADYMVQFNDDELRDQARFAQLSAQSDQVDLISDVELRPNVQDVLNQPNTQFMTKHGLLHRAGALLNKDLLNVDRFALQFDITRGPITIEERKKAGIFLPHIAKVIGLGRPLEHQFRVQAIFEEIINKSDQGIAILNGEGEIVFSNPEFERIVARHNVLRRLPTKKLQVMRDDVAARFHDLIATDAHGLFGARSRKEAIVLPLADAGSAVFMEICPIEETTYTGRLGVGYRLLTLLDTSKPVFIDVDRISDFYPLSKTEKDVLTLIAKGMSNQDIADLRNSAFETVKSQVKTLMRKTNSGSRLELIHMVRNLSAQVHYEVPNSVGRMH